MQYHILSPRRLAGAATLAGAAALIPVAALAATAAPTAAAAGAAAVPAGFQPVSASFPSPARGLVLGAVDCRRVGACRARLAVTTDGGQRWRAVHAPDVRLFNAGGDSLTQASRVSGVAFAGRQDGWLYGPALYATHDGGARWRKITLGGDIVPSLGGGVSAMAVSSGTAYAVVSPDPFHGKPDELYSSPVGKDRWARVGTITGEQAILAVSGKSAWFATSTALWATSDAVHWHQHPFGCPGAYYGLAGIAAASPSHVVFLCANAEGMFHTDKEVLLSVNGGRTEHLTGYAPVTGDDPYGGNGGIAVPPHRSAVITIAVVTPGPDYLYRSANGGKTWASIPAPGTAGGVNLSSLSYVSRTAGWIVAGGPPVQGGGDQLLLTTDAGRSWHAIRF